MRDHTKFSLLIAVCGIALTGYGFSEQRRREQRHLSDSFALESENRISAIAREMAANLAAVQSVRAHFQNSKLTPQSFDRFAAGILAAFPSIGAIEWAPRVPRERRAAFESVNAVQVSEGPPTQHRRAGERAEYCPVQFLYPRDHNEGAKGFDICFARALGDPIARASTTGDVSLTRRVKLLEKTAGGYGVDAVVPVLEAGGQSVKALEGYVLAVIQIPIVVEHALAQVPPRGLNIEIADYSPDANHQVLYEAEAKSAPARDLTYARVLDFGGRTWWFRCSATPAYVDAMDGWSAWGLLASGLLITFLVVVHIEVSARQTHHARSLVDELSDVNQRLKAEVEERKRAEEALEAARDEALAAAKTKAQFLANMSHEIRTPMNGLLGMTQLALAGPLEASQRRNLEIACSSGQDLAQILNSILDFSRSEAGGLSLETLDFTLRDEIDSVAHLFADQARLKGLQLNVDYLPGVPERVSGDAIRLKQVIANLLSNAVKFTHRGEIRLTVRHAFSTAEAIALRFEVRDTGVGIPYDAQSKLFSPFTQADGSTTRKYGGTGLGLAICKQLVQLMGGEIGLSCEPGAGAEFWFTVLVGIARTAGTPAPRFVAAHHTFNLKVLVAEDNSVNQLVARGLLEKLGCQVDVAGHGLDAVAQWRAGRYDLILMDCQMPGMDGYEAAAYIRAAERDGVRTPIVAVTAHALAGDRERCLTAGMDDYLTKPIQLDDLARILSKFDSGARLPAPELAFPTDS